MTDVPRAQSEPRRGWRRLLLALLAFVIVPVIPQFRAILPVDETMLLFVPAMAACSLVGWWAGGRAFSAVLWVALAYIVTRDGVASSAFGGMLRGWTLLLSGAFGVACLVGVQRPFFTKALGAVTVTLGVVLLLSVVSPAAFAGAGTVIEAEFARRNAEFVSAMNSALTSNGLLRSLTERSPELASEYANVDQKMTAISQRGQVFFPALLALQSLVALAVVWAVYHRLSRQRIGSPLAALREFRFNDQLVWGLILGLVLVWLLPDRASFRVIGSNLILFFGALYALRGLGVLSWFLSSGRLLVLLAVGIFMLFLPLMQEVVRLGFYLVAGTALALGIGDTWADWRNRASSTLS